MKKADKSTQAVRPKKPLKDLNFCDDFLFDVVTEDIDTCKDILEIIIGREIKQIYRKEGQKVVHNIPGRRGIRMDFYVEDIDGTLFDVEMQKDNVGNIPKRTRFYHALADAPLLKSGEPKFDSMNPIYIIVICTFDLFGRGLYQYTFSNTCEEEPDLKLEDGCHKIFLNTKGKRALKTRPALIEFLRYAQDSTADNVHENSDERLKRLHRKICEIKSSEQMEVEYMKMEERDHLIKKEGYALGEENEARRYSSLVLKLSKEKKLNILVEAAKNPDMLKALYRKYGI